MAQVLINVNVSLSAYIDIPDSKLKKCLLGEIDLSDYIEIDFKSTEKGIELQDTIDSDFDEIEFSEITKDNGNEYEWDGDKLTKI
jgi:hypothetical protein